MVTLSEIVVLGILEAFGVLVLGLFVLLFLNHRLHKRGGNLKTQLSQLKETTVFLLEKVNEYSANTYSLFLGRAVESARADTEGFVDPQDPRFSETQSEAEKATLIRYLLLDAELAVEDEPNDDAKANLRASRLSAIVQDFEAAGATNGHSSSIDEEELKNKWVYLCDAAMDLISTRTTQSEQDLIEIIHKINKDLDLDDLTMPTRKKSSTGTVEHVREESDRNRDLITRLLNDRIAAEAEVNVKVSELERLERFLKESEMCVAQLEADYDGALEEIKQLKEGGNQGSDTEEMQRTIDRYTQESTEMLICIETLEQENPDLKSQLGH